MKLLKIMRADGGISLMNFIDGADLDACLAAWETTADIAWLPVVGTEQVDRTDLPPEKTFRDAWGHDGTVNMDRARAIHRDHLRQLRAPLLSALDIEYQRADEVGDAKAKADVVARKHALRDITKDRAIDEAGTPEELSATGLLYGLVKES